MKNKPLKTKNCLIEKVTEECFSISTRDKEKIGDASICYDESDFSVKISFSLNESYQKEVIEAILNSIAFQKENIVFAKIERCENLNLTALEELKFELIEGTDTYEKEKELLAYGPIFMCLGMSVGMSVGMSIFKSSGMSIGMCIGMGFGLAVGTSLSNTEKKKRDEIKEKRKQK